MGLVTLGLNHHSAPVAVREQFALVGHQRQKALTSLKTATKVHELALLSTCNRTEWYTVGAPADQVLRWWEGYQSTSAALSDYVYLHEGEAAVRHMMRVASGLDSLVLGEPEILGQMKDAYTLAGEAGLLGSHLSRLFQQTFSAAKQVRHETAIGQEPVSIAFLSVHLAKLIFTQLSSASVLLIGAGQTIALAAKHLKTNGVTDITVVNRTYSRGKQLAMQCGAKALPWEARDQVLNSADIVISATDSVSTLIQKPAVEAALRQRHHRPMLMIDLAIPRDIDPNVSDLDEVYLYTVDDLEGIARQNQSKRLKAAEMAEGIIGQQTKRYMQWLKTRDSVQVVDRYRQKIQSQRDERLAKAEQYLASGREPKEVLAWLAHDLSQKWMHHPTRYLKEAITEEAPDKIALFCELFDMEND